MKWNSQQRRALQSVGDWLKNPSGKQVYRLFGYAGTGKTTLAQHLASSVSGPVYFCAFTGKAAHVLSRRGCEGATTIHQLIYNPQQRSGKRLRELEAEERSLPDDSPKLPQLKQRIAEEQAKMNRPAFELDETSPVAGASLVVVDECSMVGAGVGHDLLSFGVPVLVLGDPAQLPPVAGAGFFTDCEPDTMLTDVQRQARDNPIIDLATRVRRGESLPLGKYGDSEIRSSIDKDDALGVDQVLVGRNRTRRSINRRMRELRNFSNDLPQVGDRLVCLRNDHEIGLLNGSLWTVEAVSYDEKVDVELVSSEGDHVVVDAHPEYFLGRGDELGWWERKDAQEFDYGYALTVHKAQGSQWPDVLLIDESRAFGTNSNRWLYTGLTRAEDRVIISR